MEARLHYSPSDWCLAESLVTMCTSADEYGQGLFLYIRSFKLIAASLYLCFSSGFRLLCHLFWSFLFSLNVFPYFPWTIRICSLRFISWCLAPRSNSFVLWMFQQPLRFVLLFSIEISDCFRAGFVAAGMVAVGELQRVYWEWRLLQCDTTCLQIRFHIEVVMR